MSREGTFHEQTYRNKFEKDFDYLSFNSSLVEQQSSGKLAMVINPSYFSKNGKSIPGLGWFYSGSASRCKKGLGTGGLAAIDLERHTAYQ